jgi:phage gpG-like protein
MAKPLINMEMKPTLEQVKVRAAAMRKELQDRRDPNARVMVYLDQWVQHNFRSEGGKVGGWAPLAAGGRWKTFSRGAVFDPNAKILQDTGRLRQSFVPFDRGGNKVGIGSDVPYSKKHEDGEGNLPQRRMLPKKAEVLPDVRRIYAHFVGETVRRKKLA